MVRWRDRARELEQAESAQQSHQTHQAPDDVPDSPTRASGASPADVASPIVGAGGEVAVVSPLPGAECPRGDSRGEETASLREGGVRDEAGTRRGSGRGPGEDALREQLREAKESVLMAGEDLRMALQKAEAEALRAQEAERRVRVLEVK